MIAVGAKKIETRSWSTSYRGPIAIHASKKFDAEARSLIYDEPFKSALRGLEIPTGCIIATATISDCLSMNGADDYSLADWAENLDINEWDFGFYERDRFGWFITDVKILDVPILAKGKIGVWEWNENILGDYGYKNVHL